MGTYTEYIKNYSIESMAGRAEENADVLCRLPLKETPEVVPQPGQIMLLREQLSSCNSPVNVASIRSWTGRGSNIGSGAEFYPAGLA